MKLHRTLFTAWVFAAGVALHAQNAHNMVVQTNKLGAEIQPTMYGLFFEDINYGADGGLYAELVKNRSFEFPQRFMGWNVFGNVTLMDDGPFERNPHYVRLGNSGHREKHTGIENEGFFGIGVKEGAEYRFSVWARGENQKLRIELIKNDTMEERQAFESKELTVNSKDWKQYEVILKSPRTEPKAHLRIFLESAGTVDLEHVSLFPVDTWKERKNGLRKDLVQALYDIKPGVFRFPGGCIVEGTDEATRYEWKKTVGAVENRPLNENRWHYTFKHRFFPDYFQTYGLGFFEYFQLSEDIGAEPLPILNCGLVCQYQNDPDQQVSLSKLDSYIQDALDLIEFANGDVTTTWGKVRADMGHPAPFNLKFLGIGNEQWGPEYPERLKQFVEVLRKAHPEIKIVGSSGPQSEGKDFDYLWPEMKNLKVDLVDEHFYRPEGWQWRPDLIWFDNLNSVRTCSYYVQQLYSHNKGTHVLPLTMDKKAVSGQEGQDGLFASAVWDKDEKACIVKIANTSDKAQPVSVTFNGLKKSDKLVEGKCITLQSADLDKDNTVEHPNVITPKESDVTIEGNVLNVEMAPKTFVLYKFVKASNK